MRKPVSILLCTAGAILALFTCGFLAWRVFRQPDGNRPSPTAFAFKSSSGDRWGLATLDGTVLVEREWENAPSCPVEGVVRVTNPRGNVEFFTTDTQPRRVGGEYKQATLPWEGLSAVVEKGKPIRYITSKGESAFSLATLQGESVEQAGDFRCGRAPFQLASGRWGFIDRKGQVAIPARFSAVSAFREGYAIASEADPQKPEVLGRFGLIDTDGRACIPFQEGRLFLGGVSDGLIAYTDGDQSQWGFMNVRGEKVIRPQDRFRKVTPFIGGHAAFFDGERWGVMDTSGEVVVRAKYQLVVPGKDLLLVCDGEKWGYRDFKDREVISCQYQDALPFSGSRALVKDHGRWIVIDRSGEPQAKCDYADVGNSEQFFGTGASDMELVHSDFFDVDGFVGRLLSGLSTTGFQGMSQGMGLPALMDTLGLPAGTSPQVGNPMEGKVRDMGRDGSYRLAALFTQNFPDGYSPELPPPSLSGVGMLFQPGERSTPHLERIREAIRTRILRLGLYQIDNSRGVRFYANNERTRCITLIEAGNGETGLMVMFPPTRS